MCQVSGCTEPIRVRVRQLCRSHYNRWYRYGDPSFSPMEERATCKICSAPTTKRTTGPRSTYCSAQCRREANKERSAARARELRAERAQQRPPRQCAHCGELFTGHGRLLYCQPRCSRAACHARADQCGETGCERPIRARGLCGMHYNRSRRASGEDASRCVWNDARRDQYHKRRAQKAGTSSSGRSVALVEITARDKNRCHLCRKRVSSKPWPHPLSASLDHVVPLSQGGDHTPENVRLAHLRCNVSKGNRGGNEQLMLIG
jgi:hypothetical protein